MDLVLGIKNDKAALLIDLDNVDSDLHDLKRRLEVDRIGFYEKEVNNL